MSSKKDKPRTYVLFGYDQDSVVARYEQYNAKAPDKQKVHIIRAQPDETIADALKKITTPANIILHSHGSDGIFMWNRRQNLNYTTFFESLPREGIVSVTLGGCWAGSAKTYEVLKVAPPGTIVQSMIGARNLSLRSLTSACFAFEQNGFTNPTDIFLEILDNFNPDTYERSIKHLNMVRGRHSNSNPENAMSYVIGIGGKTPRRIDLSEELYRLHEKAENFDDKALDRAVARVQKRFDTYSSRVVGEDENHIYTKNHALGENAEALLDARVHAVGQKLKYGYPPENIEEKRIAYALTAAYLDETKVLDMYVSIQKTHAENKIPFKEIEADATFVHRDAGLGVQLDLTKKFADVCDDLGGLPVDTAATHGTPDSTLTGEFLKKSQQESLISSPAAPMSDMHTILFGNPKNPVPFKTP